MSTHIHISENPAEALALRFTEYVAALDRAYVAVSGGTTPRELYRALTGPFLQHIPWERITLFQVDERCVPPDNAESNWRMLHEELMSKVPALNAHRIEAERPHAAEDYESLILRTLLQNREGAPQFDLILLGMGTDGHTASLFPGTRALHERNHFVVVNEVPCLNTRRITMTYPLLNAARQRWFLVRGADKSGAFARVQDEELPASRLVDAEWFVDPAVVG